MSIFSRQLADAVEILLRALKMRRFVSSFREYQVFHDEYWKTFAVDGISITTRHGHRESIVRPLPASHTKTPPI